MINRPKVSIIVPIYNTERFLTKCLTSLINQTLSDIEIICVNDNSTDDSLKIVYKFQKKFNFIKLVNLKKNVGLSEARNTGIKIARGEFIGFVDSDDFVDEFFFERLYYTAKLTKSEIAVGDAYYYFNDGSIQTTYITRYIEPINLKILKTVKSKSTIILTTAVWNKLFDLQLIKKNNIKFPPKLFWEDNVFLFKAVINSNQIIVNNNVKYYWRKRKKSMMDQAKNNNKPLDIFKIIMLITNILDKYKGNNKNKWRRFLPYLIYYHLITRYDQIENFKIKKIFYKKMKKIFRQYSRKIFNDESYFSEGEKYYIYKFLKKGSISVKHSKLFYLSKLSKAFSLHITLK